MIAVMFIGALIVGAAISLAIIAGAVFGAIRIHKKTRMGHWLAHVLVAVVVAGVLLAWSKTLIPKGGREGPPKGEDYTGVMKSMFWMGLSPGLGTAAGMVVYLVPMRKKIGLR